MHTLNLHTTPGYPLAVHTGRNVVATGSTIHSAVMVWDLDRVEIDNTPDIKVAQSYRLPAPCSLCNVCYVFEGKGMGTCYSAAYMIRLEQQRFTISEVATE